MDANLFYFPFRWKSIYGIFLLPCLCQRDCQNRSRPSPCFVDHWQGSHNRCYLSLLVWTSMHGSHYMMAGQISGPFKCHNNFIDNRWLIQRKGRVQLIWGQFLCFCWIVLHPGSHCQSVIKHHIHCLQ
jgi:hypothetical protein